MGPETCFFKLGAGGSKPWLQIRVTWGACANDCSASLEWIHLLLCKNTVELERKPSTATPRNFPNLIMLRDGNQTSDYILYNSIYEIRRWIQLLYGVRIQESGCLWGR